MAKYMKEPFAMAKLMDMVRSETEKIKSYMTDTLQPTKNMESAKSTIIKAPITTVTTRTTKNMEPAHLNFLMHQFTKVNGVMIR